MKKDRLWSPLRRDMWRQLEQGLIVLSKREEDRLRRVFEVLDRNEDGRVCANDLREALLSMKFEASKSDLEEWIWEIDETLDKAASFQEFSLMYRRARSDKTGLEPRRLYNIVEFMMNDANLSGEVGIDEAIQLMYMRYGKNFDESEIRKLFKNGSNSVTLTDYLEYAENHMQELEDKKEEEKRKLFRSAVRRKGEPHR